jgi:hypothetical protein
MVSSSYPLAWSWKPDSIHSVGPITWGWTRRKAGRDVSWQIEVRLRDRTWISASRSTRTTVIWMRERPRDDR